jgi:hypothetical protein
MLVSSLLRSYFTGQILVIRNRVAPLFKVERKGLEEIYIEPEIGAAGAHALKYQVRDTIQSWIFPDGVGACPAYRNVLFLDCDMLALRGIDHLLEGRDWDILWTPEPTAKVVARYHSAYLEDEELITLSAVPGANSGSWAVRAEHYYAVMEEWERIDTSPPLRAKRGSDQPAWNRLLLDTKLRKKKFEKDEIMFPTLGDSHQRCDDAALIHVPGSPELKLRCLAGYFYGRYFADESGLFLNILEP